MSRPPGERLDDFEDLSGWTAVASGQSRLEITKDAGPRGAAMKLEFDFQGGKGFVVARKRFSRRLPARYAFGFDLRGSAPANRFEFKLVDPTNHNVWWHPQEAFRFPADWRRQRIQSRQIGFAWGPAGGGPLRELGAIEFAIAAGEGGRGVIWIGDLRLEDLDPRAEPVVRRSRPDASAPWLQLDFGEPLEYGGGVVEWAPGAGARAFDVQTSDDALAWTTVHTSRQAEGPRSYLYLPGSRSRFLRVLAPGIAQVDVRPEDFSCSLDAFFQSVARSERRGLYPKYLLGEQTYWSAVGVGGGSAPALLNEEGMVEIHKGGCSLEPFLFVEGDLVTWADAAVTQELELGYLPLPSSSWRAKGLVLRTTAFAVDGLLHVRYRLENTRDVAQRVRLFAALRPFQVTPPWQAFQGLGGVSPIRALGYREGALWVNGRKALVPLSAPSQLGAAAFEHSLPAQLTRGELPSRAEVTDDFGFASGALRYDLDLAPGAAQELTFTAPKEGGRRRAAAAAPLRAAVREWERKLGRVRIRVGEPARHCVLAVKTAAAHILVNREGPALQPGPRRYARSWIRDAASMAAALLRMGCRDEVREFLRWYAPHQAEDGNVPCCVDRSGPDWLPEHDSHGQLIFTIAEYFRLTGDRALLRELWPAVLGAVDYLESLRSQRLASEFETPARRACYGLLPESASHEGYLAHPVHAYWDDFWALRGLGDAAELAQALGEAVQARRLSDARAALHRCLYASIEATIAQRELDYVPASVEWADLDPAATATALATTDAARCLPAAALARTYDLYLEGFRRRRRGELDWANYSPYEIRIIGALVRLGRRADAHELLAFFLADRRPPAWNQWPEIAWRDPKSPGHIGDMPHAWIGAEYVLAVLGLFAFERSVDGALVLAAGVPAEWLRAGDEVGVTDLPTYYGPLTYTLRRERDDTLCLTLTGELTRPPGRIVVQPPLAAPLTRVSVDGTAIDTFDRFSVTLDPQAAEVRMQCAWPPERPA